MKKKLSGLLCLIILFIIFMPSLLLAESETPKPGDRKVVDITWSRTAEPSDIILPVAQWEWSYVKDINYNRTSDVWDGGTLGNSHIKDARRSWDIATWHTNRSYWNGTSHVRRFHGEFIIPDGYNSKDDIMISSVGNYSSLGLHNIIPINDNIYIFVYPKDSEINDSNFLQYLAFWTGTACQELARSVNNGELITFHGIPGTTPFDYKETAGDPVPAENLLSHTDGWYCLASKDNIGYIMENNPEAREFVIDLIIEDYAGDGGMDRLDLTFLKSADHLQETGDGTPPAPLYTVTFDPNGGSSTPSPQVIDEGKLANTPAHVTREGYIFVGWYPAGTDTPWDFDANPVTEDLILYAKWQNHNGNPVFDEVFPIPLNIVDPATIDNLPSNSNLSYIDDNIYEVLDENDIPLGNIIQNGNGDWAYHPFPLNNKQSCCCHCLCPLLWLIQILLLLLIYCRIRKNTVKAAPSPQKDDQTAETQNT